jgi:hypothetical protein
MFSLANSYQAFAEDGTLADRGLQQRLTETVSGFLSLVEADVRYVCLERRWHEFLGDCTEAAITQRAERDARTP